MNSTKVDVKFNKVEIKEFAVVVVKSAALF